MTETTSGRGGRGRTVIAMVVAAVMVVAGTVALWPRNAGPARAVHAHVTSETDARPLPIVGDTTRATVDTPETDSPGAMEQTTLAEAAGASSGRRGAESLGTPRPPVRPEDVISPETGLGGCLPEYGADGQCLPTIPPSLAEHARDMLAAGLDPAGMPHPWSCAEVRELFPDGIVVRTPGIDPQSLDTDGDGIACRPDI